VKRKTVSKSISLQAVQRYPSLMESEGGGRCSLEIVFSSFTELVFADFLSWIVGNLNEVLLGQVEWNLARP
jgi:hypothetical protein